MDKDSERQIPETRARSDRGDAVRHRAAPLRRFLGTLAIGLVIELMLHFLHGTAPLDRLENLGGDWAMALYRNLAVAPGPAVPFAYIDIDEKTYREWGEPLLLPRDRLAELIKRTLEGRPRLLIVDVDFAHHGDTGDDALAAILERNGQNDTPTPILLARTLGPASTEADDQDSQVQQTSLPRLRRSFLDPLVAQGTSVHWASVWVKVTPDAVVRRWPLWQTACDEGRSVVLPSMPLAALALANGHAGAFDDLTRQLEPLAPNGCARLTPDRSEKHELHFGERSVVLGEEGRILFAIPWHLPKGESRPLVDAGRGRAVPLLTVVPAVALLMAAEGPGRGGALDGAVAVIGGSYAEARDMYATPIGWMPGALVVVNAVHTALQYPQGALRPAPWWLEWSLAIPVVLLVAAFFTLLPIGVATIFSLLLTVAITLFASYWWLQAGIWLNVTAPVLGIVLHRWTALLEHGWDAARTGFPPPAPPPGASP